MTEITLQARLVLGSAALLAWLGLLYLLARKKVSLDHAVLWSVVLFAALLSAVFPGLALLPGRMTGAYDPMSGLYFLAFLFVGGILVYYSTQISALRRQTTRVAQEIALLRHEIERIREAGESERKAPA
ncbi:MAG: DUF2304 domain-containing protein [Planctomycetes bacterium]|nr:DUF2304 domain-containing protein [Planctomycetota bacterium]